MNHRDDTFGQDPHEADDHPDGNSGGELGQGRVWLTAQRSPHAQREGLFTPESIAHPARMNPDLAGHIIARHTRPGDWVLDPMCGIGTTVVQAVRTGRRAVGVEWERRWLRLARANHALALDDGHGSAAHLVRGDSRRLRSLLPPEVVGKVTLVLTSPPYGRGVHGQLTGRSDASARIEKRDYRYAPNAADRANLAHATPWGLASGMTAILTEAAAVLAPGGVVVLVVRPWRKHGVLIDLPEQMITCADAAGLVLTDRAAALHGRIDRTTGQLVSRPSFFQRINLDRARAAGEPTHLITHECVLVLGPPPSRRSPRIATPPGAGAGAGESETRAESGTGSGTGSSRRAASGTTTTSRDVAPTPGRSPGHAATSAASCGSSAGQGAGARGAR